MMKPQTPLIDIQLDPVQTRPVQITEELQIGGNQVVLMAGPCAIESYEQTHVTASALYKAGIRVLRGGAFKPRTSPHSFQGLGVEGLKIMRSVADEFGLLVVTEALGVEHVPLVAEYADIIQIGSRNMQHFPLLWAVGEIDKPVLLKRGFMSTIKEWLLAAEHITLRGNSRVLLCERGIRTFETATRNTLDVNAIALIKQSSPYPILADPSHATGRADLVLPAASASIAAGADGLMIEFHPNPRQALSDAEQSLSLDKVTQLVTRIEQIANALGRKLV